MAERLNRTALVEAAAALSDEIGLEALTITRVGNAVGIAPPGVYRHVSDVDDLRAAIGQLARTEASHVLAEATAGLSGLAALQALADVMRTWARTHPGRYAALQIAPDPQDVAGQASGDQVLAVIGAALRKYQLDGDDLTDAIRLVRSALHGFITLESVGGFKQPRQPEATYQRIVEGLDTVLRSWTP